MINKIIVWLPSYCRLLKIKSICFCFFWLFFFVFYKFCTIFLLIYFFHFRSLFFLFFFYTDFIITNQQKYYVKLREVFSSLPELVLKQARFLLIPSHSFLPCLSSPLLSSLPCRCSSCSSSADKASSGSRSGTCLCLTRRKRRSPESWCRQFWHASPRCAASWSGETSRLSTRGGLGGFGGGGEKWEHFVVEHWDYFTLAWAIQRPVIHRHKAQSEKVLSQRDNGRTGDHFCLITTSLLCRRGKNLADCWWTHVTQQRLCPLIAQLQTKQMDPFHT